MDQPLPSDVTPFDHPAKGRVLSGGNRTPSLDHLRLEFSALVHGDGLLAPPGFVNVIGGL